MYTLYLPEGGHNFRTWNRELLPALRWLSQRQQPSRPSPLPGGTRQPG